MKLYVGMYHPLCEGPKGTFSLMKVHVAGETIFDKWLPKELAVRRFSLTAQPWVRHIVHYVILSSQEFPQRRYYLH